MSANGGANAAQEEEDSEVDQIAIHEESQQQDVQQLQRAIADLSSHDGSLVAAALRILHPIIAEGSDSGRQCMIDCGGLPLLVSLMQQSDDEPRVQSEAVGALTTLVSGSTEQTQAVVDAGAIPAFVRLLSSLHDELLLSFAALDSIEFRDICLQAGALTAALSLLRSGDLSLPVLRNATQLVSSLLGGRPLPKWSIVREVIPVCAKLISSPEADAENEEGHPSVATRRLSCADSDTLKWLAWTLSYISRDETEDQRQLDVLLQAGAIPPLVRLLAHADYQVRIPALRTMCRIVSAADRHTLAAIDAGALPLLAHLLSDPEARLRREAAWSLANCTGSEHVGRMLAESGVFPPLVRACDEEEDEEVRKNVAWSLMTALHHSDDAQRATLMQQGAVAGLARLLGKSEDREIDYIAASGLLGCMKSAHRQWERERNANPLHAFFIVARDAGIEERIDRVLHRDAASSESAPAKHVHPLRVLSCFFELSLNQSAACDEDDHESADDPKEAAPLSDPAMHRSAPLVDSDILRRLQEGGVLEPLCSRLDPQSADVSLQLALLHSIQFVLVTLYESEEQVGREAFDAAAAIVRASCVRHKVEQLAQSGDEEIKQAAADLLLFIDKA